MNSPKEGKAAGVMFVEEQLQRRKIKESLAKREPVFNRAPNEKRAAKVLSRHDLG